MTTTIEARAGEHAEAWAAIPWCVAGTATADEQARVQRHLQGCPACRDEWALQERIRDGLRLQPAPVGSAEPGLARLLARIDADPLEQPLPSAPDAARPAWRWVRVLAVASVVQAVALGVLASLWWQRADEAGYATLSSQPEARAAAPWGQLVVQPGMPVAELQALLAGSGLRAASIGGASRVITLEAEPGRAVADADALQRLRAHPQVQFAERTGAAPR